MLTPKWGRLLPKSQLQVFLLRVSATEVFILAVGRRGEVPRVSAAYVQATVTPRWALSWRSGLYVMGQRAGGCTSEGRLDLAACPRWKEQRSMQGDLRCHWHSHTFQHLKVRKQVFCLEVNDGDLITITTFFLLFYFPSTPAPSRIF